MVSGEAAVGAYDHVSSDCHVCAVYCLYGTAGIVSLYSDYCGGGFPLSADQTAPIMD